MNQDILDVHTIFLGCPGATEQQIREVFGAALAQYRSHTPLECYFRVNLVKNGAGQSYGMAFVFVTNPAVYYMLFGRNPDGTARVRYIDDPNWISPKSSPIPGSSVRARSPSPMISNSWADWIDELDEPEPTASGPPQIKIELEPLMVLPSYTPSKEVSTEVPTEVPKEVPNDLELLAFESFAEETSAAPSPVEFMIGRAIAQPPDSKFMPNILKCNTSFLSTAEGTMIKCKGLPDWISPRRLKTEFAPYASNLIHQVRSIKGVGTDTGYPYVNINAERIAFIVFDPDTADALFALAMMRKVVLQHRDARGEIIKDQQGHPISATLIFSHSYRADRDGSIPHSRVSPKSQRSKPRAFIPVAPRTSAVTRSVTEKSDPRGQTRVISRHR